MTDEQIRALIAEWRERAALNIVPEEDGAEIHYAHGQNAAYRQCADDLDAAFAAPGAAAG